MCDVSYHTFDDKSIHVLKFNKICILCNLRPYFYTRVLKTQNINVFLPISPSWYFYTLTPKSQFCHIHPNLIPIHLSNPSKPLIFPTFSPSPVTLPSPFKTFPIPFESSLLIPTLSSSHFSFHSFFPPFSFSKKCIFILMYFYILT